MKTKAFTVRTSIEQYEKVMEYSESTGVKVADLVRQGLDYVCNQNEPKSNHNSSESNHGEPKSNHQESESNHPDYKFLQEQIEIKDKTIEELLVQHNQNQQIIMSMNQNQQKLLVESKRTWFQRLFGLNETEA